MANSYTQIHIHAVFVVKHRACIISNRWSDQLYRYITGIVQKNGHKLLAINGMPDHLHLLVGLRPSQSISDLMQDIKGDSTKWINQSNLVQGKFSWQEGYAAFSYSKADLHRVATYIEQQQQHHQCKSFTDEYLELLKEFDISFEHKYLFEAIDYD